MKRTFYIFAGLHGELLPMETVLIPFDCKNVPARSFFAFYSNSKAFPVGKAKKYLVRKILNSKLLFKYAFFYKPLK